MPQPSEARLLDDLLDSWARNNTIVVNLMRAIPAAAMDARATPTSPSVAEMFAHMDYVRRAFVQEDAPEISVTVSRNEWTADPDRERLAQLFDESAAAVAEAVRSRLLAGRDMDRHYDHPILLLQHMVWHEGYHHGQIKLALKLAGHGLDDEVAGPITWDVWMDKRASNAS